MAGEVGLRGQMKRRRKADGIGWPGWVESAKGVEIEKRRLLWFAGWKIRG
jgi:hypothetical protein